MKAKQIALIAFLVLCLYVLPMAADFVYIPFFGVLADRTTFALRLGKYIDYWGISVSFGPGLTSRNVGIVFGEKVGQDDKKIDNAMIEVQKMLEKKEPWITLDDLTKRIGLTFQKYVASDLIKLP